MGSEMCIRDRSMKKAIGETERRREKQLAHNEAHGITPRSIVKQVRDLIDGVYSEKSGKEAEKLELQRAKVEDMSEKDISREIKRLEKLMMEHARNSASWSRTRAAFSNSRLRACSSICFSSRLISRATSFSDMSWVLARCSSSFSASLPLFSL